ncbi:MAG: PAS domain S-box protein [Gallionella sp.]|nr:PAS domain S-box protein [Gallionella sp.]
MRQSEANFRALVEHSPVAMIVDTGVDADEKIVVMNQKFTELFGYTMEDVPDLRHWWQLAYPDETYRKELKTEWIRKAEKAVQNHSSIEPMETTVTCKCGASRYVRISFVSIGSRNIVAFADLTERKRAEESFRISHTRFSTIFNQAPLGIAFRRENLRCLNSVCRTNVYTSQCTQTWGAQ